VHFLREDIDQLEQPSPKQEISAEFKNAIEAKSDFTRVALDPRVPDRTVCIGAEMNPEEKRSSCSSLARIVMPLSDPPPT
jgi:hypothetical protein